MTDNAKKNDLRVLKSFSDPEIGTGIVLGTSSGLNRRVVKSWPSSVKDEEKLFIFQRISSLQCPGLSSFIPEQRTSWRKVPDVLTFEISSCSLYQLLKEKQGKSTEEICKKLFSSLISVGEFLAQSCEYHPSITQQNIYWSEEGFSIVHPYIYDSHIKNVLNNRGVLESRGSSFQTRLSAGSYEQWNSPERSKRPEVQAFFQGNSKRIATNILQTSIVLLSVALGVGEEKIKEDLKKGQTASIRKV